MDRRDFTRQAALAALSGVTIVVSGCSSYGPTQPSETGDLSGSVTANHGHRAVITSAQLGGGGSVQLDIRGSSDHPHRIQLSADDVARIAGGERVSQQSSNEQAHDHTVTFN
jgi:hypothetical protein